MDLFELAAGLPKLPEKIAFEGVTYSPDRDHTRLRGQLERVHSLLQDGNWHTLRSLADEIGCEPQSISARIRDLKKEQYGGHSIEKKHVKNGLWYYRLVK